MKSNSTLPKDMLCANELVDNYVKALEARVNGDKRHIDSGFTELDRRIPAWLHEGHLVVIAGRPSMGKSAFSQQLAENVAESGRTAIIFSLEMSGYEITERSIARRSGVPVPSLKTGENLSKSNWSAITTALGAFSQLPLLVDDASFELSTIVNNAKSIAASIENSKLPPLGCIVIDYLQLVTAKGANRNLEVGQVASRLKRLAKELSIPVIALAQLNRLVESRVDKRPVLSDLRESGQIEQDADMVVLLYRDEYYNGDNSQDIGVTEVIAAKNRHGTTGTVKLEFIGERMLFRDLRHV